MLEKTFVEEQKGSAYLSDVRTVNLAFAIELSIYK